jgi:hypothetical protein
MSFKSIAKNQKLPVISRRFCLNFKIRTCFYVSLLPCPIYYDYYGCDDSDFAAVRCSASSQSFLIEFVVNTKASQTTENESTRSQSFLFERVERACDDVRLQMTFKIRDCQKETVKECDGIAKGIRPKT